MTKARCTAMAIVRPRANRRSPAPQLFRLGLGRGVQQAPLTPHPPFAPHVQAEKDKIAADKKAAKEAKKGRKPGSPEPSESEATESVVSEAPSLTDASESGGGDGADAAAEAAPPAPDEPTKQSNPIADDGVGLLSKAWASSTAINIDPDEPPSTHLSPGDFDAEHHVHIGEGAFGMVRIFDDTRSREAIATVCACAPDRGDNLDASCATLALSPVDLRGSDRAVGRLPRPRRR